MRELVNRSLDNGQISYGPLSKEFETRFAAMHDSRYAILSNSGTSALQVALQAMKEIHRWRDGDCVIVPATTFVATANIVLHNRMIPTFVDVDPLTYNIDSTLIERAITDRTRAIIPVHLFGQPANMTAVNEIANRRGLKVIEDSCEAMFVKHYGRSVGALGDIGCFSTYVAHLLVTGVGGISTTSNPDYAAKMRSLVNHGLEIGHLNPDENFSPRPMPGRRFKFSSVGHSYRITELEAALGLAQLDTVDEMLTARIRNARHLTLGLRGVNRRYGVGLQLPTLAPGNDDAHMMYPIVLPKRESKESLMAYLLN
jgi:dTDP-4-amino-4,6-dideoxygalactose transaminase